MKSGAEARQLNNKIKAARFETTQDKGVRAQSARENEIEMKLQFAHEIKARLKPGTESHRICEDVITFCRERMQAPTPKQMDMLTRFYMKGA